MELNYETPSQETPAEEPPLQGPQDRVINFGMFKGQTYSYVLLNHFGYLCWAISQKDRGPALQDSVDYADLAVYADLAIFDGGVR
eukprot:3547432-Alexandrium_andersonii.AAC.1